MGVNEMYDPNLRISKYEWGTPEGTRHMKKMTPGEVSETMGQTLRSLRLKPVIHKAARYYLNWRKKNPGQGRYGVTQAAKEMGLLPGDTHHIVKHINNQVKKGKLPSHLALEATEVPQDKDIAKRKGTQPAKYYKGLSKSTKQARDSHFKRKTKMASDDSRAYTPAPGDANAETKPSKHTLKFKQMFGEMKESVLLVSIVVKKKL
jgi:hypothetical protein